MRQPRYVFDGYEVSVDRKPRQLDNCEIYLRVTVKNTSQEASSYIVMLEFSSTNPDEFHTAHFSTTELAPGQSVSQELHSHRWHTPRPRVSFGPVKSTVTRVVSPPPPEPLKLNRIGGTREEDRWLTEDPPRAVPQDGRGGIATDRPSDSSNHRTVGSSGSQPSARHGQPRYAQRRSRRGDWSD